MAVLWGGVEFGAVAGLGWQSQRHGRSWAPEARAGLSDRQREVVAGVAEGRFDYLRPDRGLGWTVVPGAEHGAWHANSQGIRAWRPFRNRPSEGVVRIAAVGDGLVHGNAVRFLDTWLEVLERRCAATETVNLGVPGFGPDQALLRFRASAQALHPTVAVLALSAGMVGRTLSVFHPFLAPDTSIPFAKPRFVLQDGQLKILANPLPNAQAYAELATDEAATMDRLAALDWFALARPRPARFDFLPSVRLFRLSRVPRPLVVDGVLDAGSEAFALTAAIARAFVDEARATGVEPLILLLPGSSGLGAAGPLADSLAAADLPLLQVDDPVGFRGEEFDADGHAVVAAALAGWLRDSTHGCMSEAELAAKTALEAAELEVQDGAPPSTGGAPEAPPPAAAPGP
jgi:hypothetical protein